MEIKLDNVTYYYEWLAGYDVTKPTLLCLHGFTGSHQSFDDFVELSFDVNVLVLDLLGHGQTTAYCHPYRYQIHAQIRDIAVIIEKLQLKKIYLLGYSMGGRLATAFAVAYPEKILGLILESSSPGLKTLKEQKIRQLADQRLVQKLVTGGLESFVNDWESLPLFATQITLSQSAREKIRNERLNQRVYGLVCSLMYMGTGNQPSYWSQIKDWNHFPVTIIVGQLDPKFLRIGQEMHKEIPHSNLVIIAQGGHCVHLEKTGQFLDAVQVAISKGEK